MNWNKFLIIIITAYVLYYSLNLLYDLFLSSRIKTDEAAEDEMFFAETFMPELILSKEEPSATTEKNSATIETSTLFSGAIETSGGVGLKQLFALAKDNLIQHTRAIPY